MNIVSSRALITEQTDRLTFAFLELLTEPKITREQELSFGTKINGIFYFIVGDISFIRF